MRPLLNRLRTSRRLGVAELFFSLAGISHKAGRRTVGLSLWRPDLEIDNSAALGVQVEFLPRGFWVLGLGHLGNAYLWGLATLPYAPTGAGEVFLNDFDKVESDNLDTGLIFNAIDAGSYKTRVCNRGLEDRGFQSRLVERHFDSSFRCRDDEPKLALCGFDSNPGRRDLATSRFLRTMESGLGGTMDNFDAISFHALPNPRGVTELWPDLRKEESDKQSRHRECIARENPAYSRLDNSVCGRAELGGKSVVVPFVGATAATLAVAETIRLLHGDPAYTDIKLVLSDLGTRFAHTTGNYGASRPRRSGLQRSGRNRVREWEPTNIC